MIKVTADEILQLIEDGDGDLVWSYFQNVSMTNDEHLQIMDAYKLAEQGNTDLARNVFKTWEDRINTALKESDDRILKEWKR
jgi:hypothetical protein